MHVKLLVQWLVHGRYSERTQLFHTNKIIFEYVTPGITLRPLLSALLDNMTKLEIHLHLDNYWIVSLSSHNSLGETDFIQPVVY